MERGGAMQERIVVIGASAGGIEALRSLASALPADFPAPIVMIVHFAPDSPGVLHDIIDRAGPLTARRARNGERLLPGRIYLPPPDTHLLVEPGRVRLTRGPKENRFRPAIDPLFRSAAQVYGPAAIGVVLTGSLDDGTAGLWAIEKLGGTTVIQDPADAMFPSMPATAQRHVRIDHCVRLTEVAPLLVRLTAAPVHAESVPAIPEHLNVEIKIAQEEDPLRAGLQHVTHPSTIACPDCHGVLMQLQEGNRIRFRCHTGHSYTAASLLAGITEKIEEALWTAIRSLHEGGMLMRQLAAHAGHIRDGVDDTALTTRAEVLDRHATALREIVTEGTDVSPR
jgi:two-component system chemotaxis response regulator CheB